MEPQLETRKTAAIVTLGSKLKEEAMRSSVFYDVCKLLSERARARQRLGVVPLAVALRKKDKHYSKQDLALVLKVFSDLGLGQLEMSPRGKIRALKNIKLTLQSIGMVAIKPDFQVPRNYHPAVRYSKLTFDEKGSKAPKKVVLPEETCEVTVSVILDGKEVKLTLPQQIAKSELGNFISSLYKGGK